MACNVSSCRICGAGPLEEVSEFRNLPRVTSDCVPFRPGGRLLLCLRCGAAQSPADNQWFAEIREIYTDYKPYHQSDGAEQGIHDVASGELRRRSEVLLARLVTVPGVPRSGNVIDIGCGTGVTLKAFSNRGGWRLHGLELDERNLSRLSSLDGFERLYTCSPADLPAGFDLVTMVHALEHFPEPLETLRDLRSKIAPGGFLFVEVPNANANPFDYVVADHMMHFTLSSLSTLAAQAGFKVGCLSTTWVSKELSMTAQPGNNSALEIEPSRSQVVDRVYQQINWLHRFLEEAWQAATDSRSFGLFGTSVAATWLCSILGDAVSFFVDEDLMRVGRTYMGRPVVSPDQVKAGSIVFVALTPQVADQIAGRLQKVSFDVRLPPPSLWMGEHASGAAK